MKKLTIPLRKLFQRPAGGKFQGQVLVVVAILFIILMLFVGLAIDLGRAYIALTRMQRSVDAASLAAASQFREGRSMDEMVAISCETMAMNGYPIDCTDLANPAEITIQTCDECRGVECADLPPLCTTVPRHKYVKVILTHEEPMTFLRLIDINSLSVTASAIGEAAQMDLVLVIDASESMAFDASTSDPMRDPSVCNPARACQPFEDVKAAADAFIQRVLDKDALQEEDRIAIVTFATGWMGGTSGTGVRSAGWTNDRDVARAIIQNLEIFESTPCYDDTGSVITPYGPCRRYDYTVSPPAYQGMDCIFCDQLDQLVFPPHGVYADYSNQDWSTLGTTNIGGGLLVAGNQFAQDPNSNALWVVVMLTDGKANTTFADMSDGEDLNGDGIPDQIDIDNPAVYPIGYCPQSRYLAASDYPLCFDHDVDSRHDPTDDFYDADDYARDMADFVGCAPEGSAAACNGVSGQGALIYTIGLGNEVLSNDNEVDGKPYGASLLRYIAAVGYSGDPADPICDGFPYDDWCGNYYFGATGSDLDKIFEDIASRVFTRLHQ